MVTYFSHSDISWISNKAKHTRSRQFFYCLDDNFPMEIMEEPTSLLDLFSANERTGQGCDDLGKLRMQRSRNGGVQDLVLKEQSKK